MQLYFHHWGSCIIKACSCIFIIGEVVHWSCFAQYRRQFGRMYVEGSNEHQMRQRLFAERVAKIEAHNNHDKGHSWRAGINHLTDRTEEELLQLRGFRRQMRAADPQANSLVEKACTSKSGQCGMSGSCCK